MTTCSDCIHAYMEDGAWFSDPGMAEFNVSLCCGLINPEFSGGYRHQASYKGTAHSSRCCNRFVQTQYPVRVWPARPKKLIQVGWWTDLTQEERDKYIPRPETQVRGLKSRYDIR